jgi:uncharacterized metal-binding protein YceD (DUF177 family)
MKHNREFEIAFVGLKLGIHEYNYSVDSRFFENFEKTEFHDAKVDVKLTLDKKSGIFLLHFDINGHVTLPCDRCGDDFDLTLWDEFDLVVKIIDDELVESKSMEDAEVAYIGRSESLLDVSFWIYEFIVLSVPMQHIHPDDENGKSKCNPDALNYLTQHPESDENPIWNQLKKKLNN